MASSGAASAGAGPAREGSAVPSSAGRATASAGTGPAAAPVETDDGGTAAVGPGVVGMGGVSPAGATSSEADASTPAAETAGQAAATPAAAVAEQAASDPAATAADGATSDTLGTSALAPDSNGPMSSPATSPPTSAPDPAAATSPSPPTPDSGSASSPDAGSDTALPSPSGSALTPDPAKALDSDPAPSAAPPVTQGVNDSNLMNSSYSPDLSAAPAVAGVGTGSDTGPGERQDSETGIGLGSGAGSEDADADSSLDPGVDSVAKAGSDEPTPSIGTPETATVAASPAAQPSPTTAPGGNGDRGSDVEATRAEPPSPGSEAPSTTRPPRRTYRDEPIEPEMVEADTERAGDFLEGLLDALDVDGDITTWVDEVGGHIDLEGSDLDVLVGSNGETLDALQELTRLAVLRQSKRRVRLLLDINGFRARQRERLVTIVKATAEQVIRTREDHEFQPMSPAERKIVHDAVAAIDGAVTESLGEDPHRRVVIRPT